MENWQSIIKTFIKSKLSATAFCKQHGIKRPTFYYWYKKLNKDSEPSIFIKIDTSDASVLSYEIEYPNGVKIRPLGEVSFSMLHKLINV